MAHRYASITRDNITQLVYQFYQKVRQDSDLGPIFTHTIGTSDQAWGPHLDNMIDFWSSVMGIAKCYRGSPVQKHLALPPFDLSLFDRWLTLFQETARTLYQEPIALEYQTKSRHIANNLTQKLTHHYARTHHETIA